MLETAILDTAIAFCEDTNVIRVDADPIPTFEDVAKILIESPVPQQQIARVMFAWYDDQPIGAIARVPATRMQGYKATPTAYYTTREDGGLYFNLFPVPNAAGSLLLELSLRPARDATQVDNDLLDLWADTIVAGAVSRIARLPNQSFSNDGVAATALSVYEKGKLKARVERSHGQVQSTQRVRPRNVVF